jgi:exonuclease VII large subunit
MKTIVITCMAALALAATDVAVAANGGGNSNGNAGQLHGLAQQLKARVTECKKAPNATARKECVEHLVSFLQDVKQKIDAVEAAIKQKCSGSTSGRCARAEQLVDRLEKLKARIDQLIDKLESGKDATTSTSTSNQDPNIAAIEAALGSLSP